MLLSKNDWKVLLCMIYEFLDLELLDVKDGFWHSLAKLLTVGAYFPIHINCLFSNKYLVGVATKLSPFCAISHD